MSLPAANFHQVYEAHAREVYRFALYLTGDAARAEDLTAEAFLQVWASPAPAHLRTMKSYLLAIVRNLHVQAWRRERREAPLMDVHALSDSLDQSSTARRNSPGCSRHSANSTPWSARRCSCGA